MKSNKISKLNDHLQNKYKTFVLKRPKLDLTATFLFSWTNFTDLLDSRHDQMKGKQYAPQKTSHVWSQSDQQPGTLPITLSTDPRPEFPLLSLHVRLNVNQRKTIHVLGCFSLPLKQTQKPSDHTHCFTYLNLLMWTLLSPAAACADGREVTWGPCC